MFCKVRDYYAWAEWRTVLMMDRHFGKTRGVKEVLEDMLREFPKDGFYQVMPTENPVYMEGKQESEVCMISNGKNKWYCRKDFLESSTEATISVIQDIFSVG